MKYYIQNLNLLIIQIKKLFKFTLNFVDDRDFPISWGGLDKGGTGQRVLRYIQFNDCIIDLQSVSFFVNTSWVSLILVISLNLSLLGSRSNLSSSTHSMF